MMKTVELFAGIGGFRMAADSRGIETVWANEIDPKPCGVYRDRFGTRGFHQGDIRSLAADIPPHDLLTAGFPCQPFSSAGKKKGVRDPRGTLFEIIVQVLRRHQPRFFVLENVKRLLTMERGLHFAALLSSLGELDYMMEWRLLNAMHFGLPQNRQRVFVVGIRNDGRGHHGRSAHDICSRLATIEDLEELLRARSGLMADPEQWRHLELHDRRFPSWGLAVRGRFFAAEIKTFSLARPPVSLATILQDDVAPEFDFTEATLKWLAANTPVNRMVGGVRILSNQGGGARMGYTIFGVDGVAPTLTSTTSRHYERYRIAGRYRRLTNVEYARIQGFPDDHCRAASVYDQYALFGNAVPPPLAGWVLDRLGSMDRLVLRCRHGQEEKGARGSPQESIPASTPNTVDARLSRTRLRGAGDPSR
jgi:DNA (cytosine-5)-methyltransferase 1